MIPVTDRIALDERELDFEYILASGPGGQNVNKVSTAVRLKFDVRNSPALPDDVRARLIRLGGHRVTADGVLVILAQRYRSQARNRDDAVARLVALIERAAPAPVPRRATKPTLASRRRRLDAKGRRSVTKRLRGGVERE